jgi:hypothetical protein
MKNLVVLFVLVLSISCASQKEDSTEIKQVETHKLSEEYSFKIKEIISDSRCPEGVSCIWAGEVELILSIYKEGSFYKDEALIISFKNFPENKLLLEKYTLNKKIKSIEVLPIKKQGIEIALEEYALKIIFEKN